MPIRGQGKEETSPLRGQGKEETSPLRTRQDTEQRRRVDDDGDAQVPIYSSPEKII
jgi:hypothetical protein